MNSPALRFNEFKEHMQAIPLNEVAAIFDGTHATPKYVKEGVPFYSVEQVTANNFTKTKFISEEVFEKECKRVVLERGDVLMTRIGDIGTSRLIDWDVRASFYVSLALIKPQKNVLGTYIAQYIQSPFFQRELFKRMIHVAFPKKINLGEIGKCHITAPKENEQQKIADFLSSVDRKIGLLKEKHVLLTQYKKGVVQKLFRQEIRFKDDNGNAFPDWQKKAMSQVLTPEVREVAKPKDKYLALGIRSHMKGTFQKPDSDPEAIAMEKLFIVRPNDLVVNITFAWEGAIAIAKTEDNGGLVSHRFPTYTFKPDHATHRYFKHIIQLKRFKHMLDLISPGGAGRNRVLSKSEFLKLEWELPSVKEQEKIADFLDTLDKKLDAVNEQIELTQTFKKGLLQQMFV